MSDDRAAYGDGLPSQDAATPENPSEATLERSLTDLPTAWLQQLPAALNREGCLALFRACRATRDLVLAERNVRVQFSLPTKASQAATTHAKLQRACQRCSQITLELDHHAQSASSRAADDKSAVNINASACSLMASVRPGVGLGLAAITRVELKGLAQETLVPPWLLFTCPHLTSLKLDPCRVARLPDPVSLPLCTTIKELTLGFHWSPNDQSMPRWQHQLRSLPSLSSLHITSNGASSLPPRFLECCSAIGRQITQLRFWVLPDPGPLPLQFSAWFPALVELHLPQACIEDGSMMVLLSCLTLRLLQCKGFQLQHRYTHRPCPWTQLGCGELDVESFALVPLQELVSFLPPDSQVCTLIPCNDLSATQRVVAALCRPRLDVTWGREQILVENTDIGADCDCLAATLPFLARCRPTYVKLFSFKGITPQLLIALGNTQLSSPRTTSIAFLKCTFCDDSWPLVLRSLPPVATVSLTSFDMSEAQLTEMCLNACRPVNLRMLYNDGSQWDKGWLQRVQDAMNEAGHRHVRLDYGYW